MSDATKHLCELEPFRINSAMRLPLRDAKVAHLTPKAFNTLLLLVENSGNIVDNYELVKKLWPDTFVEETSLTRNIHALRKTFGETPSRSNATGVCRSLGCATNSARSE